MTDRDHGECPRCGETGEPIRREVGSQLRPEHVRHGCLQPEQRVVWMHETVRCECGHEWFEHYRWAPEESG